MNKYKIELHMGGTRWERSWSFPVEYTLSEAKAFIAQESSTMFHYRIVPLHKPYRRHAAITPLELRGAINMLENARHHVVESVGVGTQAGFDAFVILVYARLDCVRALETL
jgi:hypothetical protein